MHKNISNIWNCFAEQIDGIFIPGHYDQSDKVELKYKKWKIVFDNYSLTAMAGADSYQHTYTRVTALMESIDGFRLRYTPKISSIP